MDKNEYKNNKSLLGFVVDESKVSKEIDNESVHLTVTSPPFLDVVDYKADNWLRCWFLDIDSWDN